MSTHAQPGPPAAAGARRWLALRWRAVRAFSFPLSVLPVLAATAAVRRPADVDIGILIASALGVLFLHAAGNLLNDLFDFRSGVDRKVAGDENRPGRLLVRGELAPRDVALEALGALVLSLPLGAYLLWRCGPVPFFFGAAAALLLYAYTGPPFRLKYHALGEAVIFVAFGPLLMIGAAWAQTGHFEWAAALLSVPVGLATTAVLLGNNMRDLEEDREGGIRTLARRLGWRGSRVGYALMVLAPPLVVAALAAVGAVGAGGLAGLAAVVPAVLLLKKVLGPRRLADIDARTARYATVFILLTLFGMALVR